jgi:hypothetical protein
MKLPLSKARFTPAEPKLAIASKCCIQEQSIRDKWTASNKSSHSSCANTIGIQQVDDDELKRHSFAVFGPP